MTDENVNTEAPEVQQETNEAGEVVSVAVAKGIFQERPDVVSVVTTEGILFRADLPAEEV